MKRIKILLFLITFGFLFSLSTSGYSETKMPETMSVEAIQRFAKPDMPVDVEIHKPSNGQNLRLAEPYVTLAFEVTSQEDLKEIKVEVLGDGSEFFFNICSPEKDPCKKEKMIGSVEFSCPLFEGQNILKVIAMDRKGNKSEASTQVNVYLPPSVSEPVPVTPPGDPGLLEALDPLPDPNSRDSWDLLVLTHSRKPGWAFLGSLRALVHHKNKTGMPTILLTLDANVDCTKNSKAGICGNDMLKKGIYEIPELRGWDHPEIIKKAIEFAKRKWRIKYVMLVGDSDCFPVRYIKIYDLGHHGHRFEPSDLYYADLYNARGSFDNWDYDGDHLYGEAQANFPYSYDDLNQDRIDLIPDVAVGRVPASNNLELSIYIQKVIKYEKTAASDWFKRALLVAGNVDEAIKTNDEIGNMLTSKSFDLNKQYYDQVWPITTGAQRYDIIKHAMDQGVGFVHYNGHGYGASSGKNGGGWHGWYEYREIPKLINRNRLPIIFSAACETAIFHFGQFGPYFAKQGYAYDDTIINPHKYRWAPEPISLSPKIYDRDSLAEHFLVKGPQGAIAFIGSYGGVQISGELSKYFFQAYTSGIHVLGDVWNKAIEQFKINYIDNKLGFPGDSWYTFAKTRHIHKMLLFGDPSLRIGGLMPDLIPKAGPNNHFCRKKNGKLLVTVLNQGDVSAATFKTWVDFSDSGGQIAVTKALAAGESTDLLFDLPKTGNKPLRITVDSGLDVSESNEDNNIADIKCID